MDALAQKLNNTIPRKKINVFNDDFLIMSSLPYFLNNFVLIYAYFNMLDSAFPVFALYYIILPLLDQIFELDFRNPTEKQRKQLQQKNFLFNLAVQLDGLFLWMLFFKTMGFISELKITPNNMIKLFFFLFNSISIQTRQFLSAHQIFHKPSKIYRILGTVLMLKNLLPHYMYEHIYSHHRRVATPQDATSCSQKGMTVHKFFLYSYPKIFTSVYEIQAQQKKKSFYNNYAVLSALTCMLFTLAMFKIYGIQAGIYFLICAIGSTYYLIIVNYIEHYGLKRQKLSDGTYEKVNIKHSWNAAHRFSNYILLKVQRHSDHHQNGQKPYQTLLSLHQSPQLPHGYTACSMMALYPQLWFKIMDPLVDEYKKMKTDNINGENMQKAVKQTRKFVIKTCLVSAFLMVLSKIIEKSLII